MKKLNKLKDSGFISKETFEELDERLAEEWTLDTLETEKKIKNLEFKLFLLQNRIIHS